MTPGHDRFGRLIRDDPPPVTIADLPACEHDVPLRYVCDACSDAADAYVEVDARLGRYARALGIIAERSSDPAARTTARRALTGDPDPDPG